jgi:hypothetical protein
LARDLELKIILRAEGRDTNTLARDAPYPQCVLPPVASGVIASTALTRRVTPVTRFDGASAVRRLSVDRRHGTASAERYGYINIYINRLVKLD